MLCSHELSLLMHIAKCMPKGARKKTPTLGTCSTARVDELAAQATLTALPLASSRQLAVDSGLSVA